MQQPQKNSSDSSDNSDWADVETAFRANKLGAGSYGEVYLGLIPGKFFLNQLDQQCAIKTLNKSRAEQEKWTELVRSEIKNHKKLKHTHIVEWLGMSHNSSTVYLFLEYMPQGTLHQYIFCKDQIVEKQIESFLSDIICGLEYLHVDMKLLHRDLKLVNILLKDNVAKIADFGFSIRISKAKNISFAGTPNKIAPEILLSEEVKKTYTPATDMYSFGVICWEIIYHCEAYEDRKFRVISTSSYVSHYPLLKQVKPIKINLSPKWHEMMRDCLSYEPSVRPLTTTIKHYIQGTPDIQGTPALKNRSGFFPFWENRHKQYPSVNVDANFTSLANFK